MSKEFLAVCSSGKCWVLRYGVCEVSVREVRDQWSMAGRTWGLVVAVVIVVIVVVVVLVVLVVVVEESKRRRVSTLWAESMLPAVEAGLSVSVVQTVIFRMARSAPAGGRCRLRRRI